MDRIRACMMATGALILAIGLAWIAHGTGIIRLPATDFMNDLSIWTINGSLVCVFGLLVLLGSWRLLHDEPRSEPEDGFGE
jgi:hypothetical protein